MAGRHEETVRKSGNRIAVVENKVHFSSHELEASLSTFAERGITEFTLQDEAILSHKGRLLHFLQVVSERAPDLFLTLPINAAVLDMDIAKAASNLYCSLEIPLEGTSKGGSFLFDKKFYSKRAAMLNTLGLVFGFSLTFAAVAGDSVKAFRDRLDFAVSLYPNHIDFPQLETDCTTPPKPSATFSTQDIRMTKETAFACETFYTAGRAVTWFLSVLAPLKMSPSRFFQDFAEWQNHNNCSVHSKWNPTEANHTEIEKMQLAFLKFKYDEKNKPQLFDVVSNIVRLNGALSRCYGEGEESRVELCYNPDELLSAGAMDVQSFFENSFIENSTVKVFMGADGVEYRYS
ncbi:MAG: hypothetical protein IJS09_06310 [Treponema sp.]|nr:hypothetical protein [Treponema sp.]